MTWWNWLLRHWNKGRIGERAAAGFLREQGYTILEKNVRFNIGEIDIVAREGDILCIVEVKRRLTRKKGTPEDAITRAKYLKLRKLTQLYIKARRLGEIPVRIDMVAVDESSGRREIRLHRSIEVL